MPPAGRMAGPEKRAKLIADLKRDRETRESSYRAQALKLFPHVCGRCNRELTGKRLKELTVHHKDHDHNNNPSDGSNWELLCIYCHDHEHEKYKMKGLSTAKTDSRQLPPSVFKPFEGLDALLKKDDDKSKPDPKEN